MQTSDGTFKGLVVCLYSDPNFVAINIFENLLSQNCFVNIVTSNIKEWNERIAHISNNSHFNVSNSPSIISRFKYNYLIFVDGFLSNLNVYDNLENTIKQPKFVGVKTLAVFPSELFDREHSSNLSITDTLCVVYLGDVLGPRMDLDSDLLVATAVKEMLNKRTISLGVGEVFYPLFISDAVRVLTKWLFSFGPYGKEIFLLGSQISGSEFWKENQKLIPETTPIYKSDKIVRSFPRGYEVKTIPSSLHFALLETYKWMTTDIARKTKPTIEIKKNQIKRKKTKRVYPRFLKPMIFSTLSILLFPLLSIFISLFFFFISYKHITSGRTDGVDNKILIAKTFAVFAKKESGFLSNLPLIRKLYKETYFTSQTLETSADIVVSLLPLGNVSENIFTGILGDEIYNPSKDAEKIKTSLDYVYLKLSNFQLTSQEARSDGVYMAKKLLEIFNFNIAKNFAVQGQKLSSDLPEILGVGKRKMYLVLFENNMELRPTGGFIGSYGIMTFDEGRMSDLTVNDIYSADGQLNGHIEPPPPIKKYLNEANWWFRDSNWDPDFPTSAKRAEWFLDKEIGRQVDGVVSTDLFPIKEILKSTGPVFLPDFNMELGAENLYEKTQSEVQDNFFPGTHKKASFLTALSRSLLAEVGKVDGAKKLLILKSLAKSLEGRHIQIYSHDEKVQKPVSELGWDGAVIIPNCGQGCYPDLVGLVEANVGVNKSNFFITREGSLKIDLIGNEIHRELKLELKNSANSALGPSGKYKTYLRLMIPTDSEVVQVESIGGGYPEILTPDITEVKSRLEVGVLVEVLGNSSKTVLFKWKSTVPQINDIDSYGLYFRKQAGVSDDNLNIDLTTDKDIVSLEPTFTLTDDGVYRYNTILARDFFSRMTWIKKH